MAGYATDSIYLDGKAYPVRMINFSGPEFPACDQLVSVASLNDALFDKNGEYASDRAREIDEAIFFFVPDDIIETATDKELCEYALRNCL